MQIDKENGLVKMGRLNVNIKASTARNMGTQGVSGAVNHIISK
jgi:hypothetical protein